MSRSPSYHPIQHRRRNCALFLFCALVVSCAAQPKESGKAADSAAMAKAPVAAPVMNETLQTQSADEAKDSTAAPAPANAVAPASPRSKAVAPASPRSNAVAPASPRSKAESKRGAVAPKPFLDESEAQPAYAEPPELTQALAEFDAHAETLSTSRACDDACRALQSMRRSAQRICELVLNDDPRARCRTARARLEQAEKELSVRCTTCT